MPSGAITSYRSSYQRWPGPLRGRRSPSDHAGGIRGPFSAPFICAAHFRVQCNKKQKKKGPPVTALELESRPAAQRADEIPPPPPRSVVWFVAHEQKLRTPIGAVSRRETDGGVTWRALLGATRRSSQSCEDPLGSTPFASQHANTSCRDDSVFCRKDNSLSNLLS